MLHYMLYIFIYNFTKFYVKLRKISLISHIELDNNVKLNQDKQANMSS